MRVAPFLGAILLVTAALAPTTYEREEDLKEEACARVQASFCIGLTQTGVTTVAASFGIAGIGFLLGGFVWPSMRERVPQRTRAWSGLGFGAVFVLVGAIGAVDALTGTRTCSNGVCTSYVGPLAVLWSIGMLALAASGALYAWAGWRARRAFAAPR